MRSIFDNVEYEKDVKPELRKLVDIYLDEKKKLILDGIKSSIFLTGVVGTGKTRAVKAIEKHLNEKKGKWFTSFYNFTDLMSRVRFKTEDNDFDLKLDNIAGFPGVLIIDDFGAKQPSPITIDQLYLILNYRYEHILPTIITSNLSLQEVETLFGERISSRIDRMSISFKL